MDRKTRSGSTAAATSAFQSAPAVTSNPSMSTRVSNALKEFLWLISDIKNGRVLDLGPASQSTINFLIQKSYRITTEDLLRSWKEFLLIEEERLRKAPVGKDSERITQVMLAEKFLEEDLQYAQESYCGVLAWDLFDYLDAELMPRVMDRLFTILQPGGAILALFHTRAPERFHRYRIVDGQTIELVPAPTLAVHARTFQNREVLDMFGKFRSSKTFVGRDGVREGLFLK